MCKKQDRRRSAPGILLTPVGAEQHGAQIGSVQMALDLHTGRGISNTRIIHINTWVMQASSEL